MYLKEAFQYQNHLSSLLNTALGYLNNTSHTRRLFQLHKRSRANPNVDDVILSHEDLDQSNEPHFPILSVVMFATDVLTEKEQLAMAIDRAKLQSGFSLDAQVAVNRDRQRLESTLTSLARNRMTRRKTISSDYMVNAEGNQVSYFYDMEETSEPSYDVFQARVAAKHTTSCCRQVSEQIERFMLGTAVDFTPRFDMTDSFLDTLSEYVSAIEANPTTDDERYIRHAV